jgi:hypothetical protein
LLVCRDLVERAAVRASQNPVGCAGRFDPALFDTPDGKLIARHVSRDTAVRVLDAHYATGVKQFRA